MKNLALKKLTLLLLAVLMVFFYAPDSFAGFDKEDWRYFHELKLPGPGPRGFVAVPVIGEVSEVSKGELQDIRVITPDGEEIPYVLIVQQGKVVEKQYRPEIINKTVVGDRRQEFVADLGSRGNKNNRMEINTPSRNFKRPVAVYGSDDASSWKLLRQGFSIFDFSGDVHARSTSLQYPENIFRYLKVEIGLEGGSPLDISGAVLHQREIKYRHLVTYEGLDFTAADNERKKFTGIDIDLPHCGLPVHELVLRVPDREFYRNVKVYQDSDQRALIGTGVIHRYRVKDFINESLTISFDEKNLCKARILIENYDSRPLSISEVKARGYRRLIIFRPPKDKKARLFCGATTAKKPIYDLARLYTKIREEVPPLGTILPRNKNPDYKPVEPPAEPKDHSWMVWLALIPAAIFLAFLLMKSVRKIEDNGENGGGS